MRRGFSDRIQPGCGRVLPQHLSGLENGPLPHALCHHIISCHKISWVVSLCTLEDTGFATAPALDTWSHCIAAVAPVGSFAQGLPERDAVPIGHLAVFSRRCSWSLHSTCGMDEGPPAVPEPVTTTNPAPVSVDLLILGISHKWNHTLGDFLGLASLTEHHVFKVHPCKQVSVLHSFS